MRSSFWRSRCSSAVRVVTSSLSHWLSCRFSSSISRRLRARCTARRSSGRCSGWVGRTSSSSSTTSTWTGPPRAFSATLPPPLACYERDVYRPREQPRPLRPSQQLGHGAPTLRAVVDGVGVHVHADEPIRAGVVQPAAELLRVGEGLGAVLEPILDARFQVARNVAYQRHAEVAPHHVAA